MLNKDPQPAGARSVLILVHDAEVLPGFCEVFLRRHNIPLEIRHVYADDPVPDSIQPYAGLILMGGPMSVNDPLPWIARELALVGQAVQDNVPVLGHCLGGQLLARALGGTVSRSPVAEVGWHPVIAAPVPEARQWLGDLPGFSAFQWHFETFSIPHGAVRILENSHCRNQAFVKGPHLGMQFHVEMTEALVQGWISDWTGEAGTTLQTAGQMRANLHELIQKQQAVASRLYQRWIEQLRR